MTGRCTLPGVVQRSFMSAGDGPSADAMTSAVGWRLRGWVAVSVDRPVCLSFSRMMLDAGSMDAER